MILSGRAGPEASRLLAKYGVPVRVLAAVKTKCPCRPERLSYADAALRLSKVLGRQISFRPNTCEEQKQAMINAGLPEVVAEDSAKALSLFADGDADYVTDDVPKLLGPAARSFEQCVTDYAAAFS